MDFIRAFYYTCIQIIIITHYWTGSFTKTKRMCDHQNVLGENKKSFKNNNCTRVFNFAYIFIINISQFPLQAGVRNDANGAKIVRLRNENKAFRSFVQRSLWFRRFSNWNISCARFCWFLWTTLPDPHAFARLPSSSRLLSLNLHALYDFRARQLFETTKVDIETWWSVTVSRELCRGPNNLLFFSCTRSRSHDVRETRHCDRRVRFKNDRSTTS